MKEKTWQPCGLSAGHHVLDRAVLPRGVHGLEDEQQRPLVLGVELLLQLAHPLAPLLQVALPVLLGSNRPVSPGSWSSRRNFLSGATRKRSWSWAMRPPGPRPYPARAVGVKREAASPVLSPRRRGTAEATATFERGQDEQHGEDGQERAFEGRAQTLDLRGRGQGGGVAVGEERPRRLRLRSEAAGKAGGQQRRRGRRRRGRRPPRGRTAPGSWPRRGGARRPRAGWRAPARSKRTRGRAR